ncbi:MAG: hypothetical protein ACK5Z5_02145 [Neisseriaceae bacterium]|jgi:hypothetical protein
MLKTDISNKEGRRELINHVLHESHLEGFDATPSFATLLDNFIEGKISLDAVQSIILKESNKFAMEKKVNKEEIVFSKTMDYEIARSTLIGLSATLYHLESFEKDKNKPDLGKIKFYKDASSALWSECHILWKATEEDIENIFETISPILKACNLSKSKEDKEKIIENNKMFLQSLIDKVGLRKAEKNINEIKIA